MLRTLGIPRLERVRLRRVFRTGFEDDADLAGFYSTPQSLLTRHKVRRGGAHRGARAHVAWLTGASGSEPVDGPNHRGYPSDSAPEAPGRPVQLALPRSVLGSRRRLHRTQAGRVAEPRDTHPRQLRPLVAGGDRQRRLGELAASVPCPGSGPRRAHVPAHRQAIPARQLGAHHDLADLDGQDGAAAVWQNGVLMSAAPVRGGDGSLDQLHFGLYAHPHLPAAPSATTT